jgi:Formiminotransferase domain, N-terminal subdomain
VFRVHAQPCRSYYLFKSIFTSYSFNLSLIKVQFAPLGDSSASALGEVAAMAKEFARKLYDRERLPVFTYGHASGSKIALKNLRKDLGYFDIAKISEQSASRGLSSVDTTDVSKEKNVALNIDVSDTEKMNAKVPCIIHRIREAMLASVTGAVAGSGGLAADARNVPYVRASMGSAGDLSERKGVTLVGAVPFIQNFNMRFRAGDDRALIKRVTAAVRDDSVEALTLRHDGSHRHTNSDSDSNSNGNSNRSSNGSSNTTETPSPAQVAYEVACNLKRPSVVTPAEVLRRANALIAAESLPIAIEESYTTGPTESELLALLASHTNIN